MRDDPKVLNYLALLRARVEEVIMTLPEDISGRAYDRKHSIQLDLQGPRLGVFTLVLGSESPELVYDERYIGYQTIPEGLDEVIEFAEETIDDVASFVLSSEPPVVRESSIFRRSYLCMPSNHGRQWKLKRFS